MADGAERQIEAARRLIAHFAELLDANLSVRLWNGERLPLGRNVASDLGFIITSPAAITRLVRRPKFDTLVELLASGEIDIEGGTLIDIAHRRGEMRTKSLFRRIDKMLALKSLWPFVFGTASSSETQAYQPASISTSVAAGPRRQGADPLPLRPVERLLRALPRPGDGLHLRLFPRLERRIDRGAARQARHDLPQAAPEAGRPLARHRLRLGRAGLPCRAALRRERAWRDAVEEQSALAQREGRRASACRTA